MNNLTLASLERDDDSDYNTADTNVILMTRMCVYKEEVFNYVYRIIDI